MLTVFSFFAFTFLVAAVAWWKTRGDRMDFTDAYFLGGRSLSAWVIAGSIMLTNLSTEHLIGLNGDAFNHTVAVTAWETTAALAMVLMALFFLPRFLKIGLVTIPDYLAKRYDEHTRTIATILFLFSYVLAILPVVLVFGAQGLEGLFDVSANFGLSETQTKWLLIWVVGSLGSLYAICGGLKAVAISDTVNGVGFLLAGLFVPIMALIMIGEGNMLTGLTEVHTEDRQKFDITGNEPNSFLPFSVLFTGMIVNQVFFWCTNQSIIQRSLGAKSLAEGQKGVLIAACFKLLGLFIIVFPGVIAYHMFKNTLGPDQYLLAYPMLVKTVLPPALIGIFAAVMVGAILSTFNSVLNSSATLFSQGIYRALINKNANGRQMVRSGRWCSVVLALSAMVLAPLIDTTGSLYSYLQMINATFFGPMLAVILLGFAWSRASAFAAKLVLVVGPVWFYLLVFAFGPQIQSFLQNLFGISEEIHFLHFLGFVFVLMVILMMTISYFRPATTVYRAEWSRDVDIRPWRHARKLGFAISLATVAFYVLLAQ